MPAHKMESASSQQRSYYAFAIVLSQYASKFLPGLHQCSIDISFLRTASSDYE
jgi:hypothetical protein